MVIETEEDTDMVRDWRKGLRTPSGYRIINKTLRSQTQFITAVAMAGIIVLIILFLYPRQSASAAGVYSNNIYNDTYPLTAPIRTDSMHTFRIGIIADLDTNSKDTTENNIWYSYFKKGYLSYSPAKQTVVISWDESDPVRLTSSLALNGRGMELSELVVFDGRLLTFDDRTGVIFEIVKDKVIPWVMLVDGNGQSTKGFKSEWAAVKNQKLYVGSMGKEWTTPTGLFVNNDPQYIKIVTTKGMVLHRNWVAQYQRVREILNIYWPGYMIHESGVWSDIHQKWFFLPRRCSADSYNDTLDEVRGCSWLISADENIQNVVSAKIANSYPSRGFSSFKFIPNSNDRVIVALHSEELEGKTATYITAFTVDGHTLLEDTLIADVKYEGLEFI